MKTKITLFAAAFLAVATGLIALSVSTSADAGLAAVEARLALMPPDPHMVVSVDLAALRRSAIYSRMHGTEGDMVDGCPELGRLIAETGLDPRKDVDTFLVAARMGDGAASAVGIVTGRFDPVRLADRLRKEDAARHVKETKVEGYEVFHVAAPASDVEKPDLAVAFLGRDAIAFGDAPGLSALLGRARRGEAGFHAANADVLAGIDTRSHVFGIARTSDAMARLGAVMDGKELPPAAAAFKTVDTLAFSLDATDRIDVGAWAACGRPEDALLVHDAIKGLLAMGKLSAREADPELGKLLDGAMIQVMDKAVSFSMQVPAELIEKWHEKAREMKSLHHPAPISRT